jgi:transcription initiation factor TFIIF subunit alpha
MITIHPTLYAPLSFRSRARLILQDSSDSSETIKDDKSEKSVKGDKEKEKEKEKENTKSAPGSAERPPRPQSRGPSFRQTTSPSGSGNGKRPNYPQHGKSGTAPPGSGAAFLAHRATGSRGASPKARSRGNSPHNRATSPESRDGRGMSPPSRDVSPSRALSPGREGTPTHQPQHNRPPGGPSHGKRKTTTASPQPGSNTNTNTNTNSPKRKPSPTPSNNSEPRSKKKKSSTPDVAPFPLQITQSEVIAWFKTQPEAGVAMSGPIKAFAPKLKATASEHRDANQKLFMRWVNEVTVKENGKLVLKPEYKS